MSWTLRTLTRFHKELHRISGGRLGRALPGGAPILWLTTPGRKSGQPRVTPLLCAQDEVGNWIVAGSAGGNSKIPNWALNARAASANEQADCWIEVAGDRFEIQVVEITDELERAAAYKRLIQKWRFFQNYSKRASRTIPVFRLIPKNKRLSSPEG